MVALQIAEALSLNLVTPLYILSCNKLNHDQKINSTRQQFCIRVVEKFHSSINKIALIDRFHEIETDGELIFQLFY